jgi:hypothetical protein
MRDAFCERKSRQANVYSCNLFYILQRVCNVSLVLWLVSLTILMIALNLLGISHDSQEGSKEPVCCM